MSNWITKIIVLQPQNEESLVNLSLMRDRLSISQRIGKQFRFIVFQDQEINKGLGLIEFKMMKCQALVHLRPQETSLLFMSLKELPKEASLGWAKKDSLRVNCQ